MFARFSEITFKKEEHRLAFRLLLVSTLSIFVTETAIMLVLEYFLPLPKPWDPLLDGLTLAVIIFPFSYLYIVRPMQRQFEARYRADLELKRSNQILERFFSVSHILIAILDTDFNFMRVNQAYAQADNRRPDEFVGKNYFDLYPNEENRAIFENVVRTVLPITFLEKPFVYPGSPLRETTYLDWNLMPIKDHKGQVDALILVLNNVSERKRAQMALTDSERRFRGVFDQTFQHIALLNTAGLVLNMNQTAQTFFCATQSTLAGQPIWHQPWWQAASEADEDIHSAVLQAASNQTVRLEKQLRSGAGEQAVLDITIKPLHDDNGQVVLLIYEAREITRHVRAEEALLRSQGEINRLYQNEKRAHQLAETLRSISLALSGSLNSMTVLETLLEHLSRVIPFTSAHVNLLENEDLCVTRIARGEDQWEAADRQIDRRFQIGHIPILTPLLENRQAITILDTAQTPELPFIPGPHLVRSWLGIPLLAGEQVIGFCALEHSQSGYFNEEAIHWATAISSQAAIAIQNAWLFEQVQDGRHHLQALSRRLVEAQEMERQYIARELHDEAGQALTSLKFGLRSLELDSGEQPAIIAHCQELKEIADRTLENLHRLAVNLRPATLDHLGLVAALRALAQTISDQQDLTVQFETVGNIERMPGEVETAIYRIVQESLTNVVHHARASRVDILLERRNSQLVVIIEDNGIGFYPHIQKEGSLGLVGMRERADMLGGRFAIESAPGQGSTIFLEVPCRFEF